MFHKIYKSKTNANVLSRNNIGRPTHQCCQKDEEEEEEEKKKQKNTADQKRQILYHDAPKGRHHTLNRFKLTHNWRRIIKDAEEYIGDVNSFKKLNRRTKMPSTITSTPTKPFEKCALDIVGLLTVTTNGTNTY